MCVTRDRCPPFKRDSGGMWSPERPARRVGVLLVRNPVLQCHSVRAGRGVPHGDEGTRVRSRGDLLLFPLVLGKSWEGVG